MIAAGEGRTVASDTGGWLPHHRIWPAYAGMLDERVKMVSCGHVSNGLWPPFTDPGKLRLARRSRRALHDRRVRRALAIGAVDVPGAGFAISTFFSAHKPVWAGPASGCSTERVELPLRIHCRLTRARWRD